MFETDLFDLGTSQLLLDQLLQPALEELKTYFYVSGVISLLLLAALIYLFAFYLPKRRKEELEQALDLHFHRFARQIEAEYSIKFQELSKALAKQNSLLQEVLNRRIHPERRETDKSGGPTA